MNLIVYKSNESKIKRETNDIIMWQIKSTYENKTKGEICFWERYCFIGIAGIGQTKWIHTSPRFMGNVEIVIEEIRKQ